MPAGEYPNSFSAIQAFGLEFSQTEYICAWQALQNPQAIGKGTTTRSPALSVVTAPPTSTTSPMNSCPSTSPLFSVGTKPPYRCRSEPQIAVEVILTMASRSVRNVLDLDIAPVHPAVGPHRRLPISGARNCGPRPFRPYQRGIDAVDVPLADTGSCKGAGFIWLERLRRALLHQPAGVHAGGTALGAHDLTGFDDLFE